MTVPALPLHSLYRFDTEGKDPETLIRLAEEALDDTAEPSRSLICRFCRNRISSDDQRIDVAGAHSHTCTNPHGVVYQVDCFSDAPGCQAIGSIYREYSWFAGYRWQVVICGRCQEHFGWLFHGEQPFYGLIHDRLQHAGGDANE